MGCLRNESYEIPYDLKGLSQDSASGDLLFRWAGQRRSACALRATGRANRGPCWPGYGTPTRKTGTDGCQVARDLFFIAAVSGRRMERRWRERGVGDGGWSMESREVRFHCEAGTDQPSRSLVSRREWKRRSSRAKVVFTCRGPRLGDARYQAGGPRRMDGAFISYAGGGGGGAGRADHARALQTAAVMYVGGGRRDDRRQMQGSVSRRNRWTGRLTIPVARAP